MIAPEALISATNQSATAQQCGGLVFQPGQTRRVGMDFVAGFSHVAALRFDFSELPDLLAARDEDGAPVLDLWCPLSGVDGYGVHALALHRGLQQIGARVHLRDVGIIEPIGVPADLVQETRRNRARVASRVAVAFTLPYDPHLYNAQSLVRIALTQFETDRYPVKHVNNINKCDHLIVTSAFQVRVARASGVRIPISVMVPGVDTERYTPNPRAEDGLFKVLILGALTGRKDPLAAIRIFQQASQGDPAWRLTIKSRHADGIDVVREQAGRDPRVAVVVEDTHPDAVLRYYQAHDCLLWPSKGEGVGLPPLEAMSCGLEVVCAYNSGMKDYLDPRWSWPVESERMEPAGWPQQAHGFSRDYVQQFGEVGNWWVPSEADAAAQLRSAWKARMAGRGKGPLAAAEVRRNHTLRHQAQSVLDVVEEYLDV